MRATVRSNKVNATVTVQYTGTVRKSMQLNPLDLFVTYNHQGAVILKCYFQRLRQVVQLKVVQNRILNK